MVPRLAWFVVWLLATALVAGCSPAGRGQEAPAPDVTLTLPPEPEVLPEFPARMLARGDLGFPFLAYDTFGPGRVALAAPAERGSVAVLVAEFSQGSLQAVSTVGEPMGAVLDVTHGHLLNNGEPQAVVTTEKGLLILLRTEQYFKVEQAGLEKTFVGDWDGDGKSEAAIVHTQEGRQQVTVIRYTPEGQGEAVGSFAAPEFPLRAAVLQRGQGERTLLMGAEHGEGSMQVTFYSLDPVEGLKVTARYPLGNTSDEPFVSFSAGELAGRPTLVVSRLGDPSYLELFDSAAEGMPSRGRIALPDDEVYVVMPGTFAGQARSELLAMTPDGRWVLYGLD